MDRVTEGPLLMVGSSMGGWIMLHGQRDPDVPWQTALRLALRLQSDEVTVELIKAGDHRLSSAPDLARITAAIQRLAGSVPAD